MTVKRPWYTFDVIQHVYITFQNVGSAPTIHTVEELDAVSIVKKINRAGSEAPLKNQLILADYPGTCSMVYDKICYNIEEKIQSQLTLQFDVPPNFEANSDAKFPSLKIVLYKIETGGKNLEIL